MCNWSVVQSDTHTSEFPVMACMLAGWWVQCVCVYFLEVACVDMLLIPSVRALSCPVCLPVSVLSPKLSICRSSLVPLRCLSSCPLLLHLTDIRCYTGVITIRKTSTCMRNDDSVDLCIFNTHTHTHIDSQLSPVPWSVLRGWDVVGWGRWSGETRAQSSLTERSTFPVLTLTPKWVLQL